MDKLTAAGFAAGCFPRLGAGLGAALGTVGASSFWGIHFSSGMSQVKYNVCSKVWPSPQVPRADPTQTTPLVLHCSPWGEGKCVWWWWWWGGAQAHSPNHPPASSFPLQPKQLTCEHVSLAHVAPNMLRPELCPVSLPGSC